MFIVKIAKMEILMVYYAMARWAMVKWMTLSQRPGFDTSIVQMLFLSLSGMSS